MPEPQQAVQSAVAGWDNFRLWAALGISILSFIWSERNRRAASQATKDLRSETVRLEEFRSGVKGPLLDALADCEEAATRAEAIAHTGKPFSELKDEVDELNRFAISALSKLESRLTDANESSFTGGADWLDDFNDLEDKVLGGFNEASNSVNADTKRSHALLKVKTSLTTLRSKTKSRVEAEIAAITTSVRITRMENIRRLLRRA